MGNTGHAEVVQVEYDPARISYDRLLEVFWENHDPTTPNRQGPDVGEQYRSLILFQTRSRRPQHAPRWNATPRTSGAPSSPSWSPPRPFYAAETYHQRYLEKHGRVRCNR